MVEHSSDEAVNNFWIKHYLRRGMCSLCGQSGILDTRATAITATGLRCGEVHFCICPNGQVMRAVNPDARTWQKQNWKRSQEES